MNERLFVEANLHLFLLRPLPFPDLNLGYLFLYVSLSDLLVIFRLFCSNLENFVWNLTTSKYRVKLDLLHQSHFPFVNYCANFKSITVINFPANLGIMLNYWCVWFKTAGSSIKLDKQMAGMRTFKVSSLW